MRGVGSVRRRCYHYLVVYWGIKSLANCNGDCHNTFLDSTLVDNRESHGIFKGGKMVF